MSGSEPRGPEAARALMPLWPRRNGGYGYIIGQIWTSLVWKLEALLDRERRMDWQGMAFEFLVQLRQSPVDRLKSHSQLLKDECKSTNT